MEYRTLGRTGLEVSVLSFGCGAVGGLMVKGSAADQERAVARAMDSGINYFDTATLYGNGESERNLGRVLKSLKRPRVYVGTKVVIGNRHNIAQSAADSLDASLQRLGLDSVDVFYLHNFVSEDGREGTLDPTTVLEQVVPAFQRLREKGKTRFLGFTALGDTAAVHHVLNAFDVAQVCYNLLNPSAGGPLPPGYPAQDYGNLLGRVKAAGVGTVGIRVLAGGALSGVEERHPLGMTNVDPIGSAATYAGDVARARRLSQLVERGFARSLVEASLRFAITNPDLSTTLVGLSTLEQLEYAVESVEKGPLPAEALALVSSLQRSFAGEAR